MNTIRLSRAARLAAASLALAACQESPVEPPAAALVASSAERVGADRAPPDAADGSATRQEALRDVIERVLPELAPNERSAALGATLREAIAALDGGDAAGARRALQAADYALDQYDRRADAAASPDLDAIRLAVRTSPAH